jgi:hypothetical protein
MALTKIEICNHALLKIGADVIASLDVNQNTTEATIQSARLCNLLFDQAYEEVLRTYQWNSATKRIQLQRLVETPAFRFDYAYQLPNDFIRAINIYSSKEGYDDGAEYSIEGRTVLTNYDTVFLLYISKVGDVTQLDPFVTRCVIQNLSIKLSVPMQLDQTMQNNLIEEYKTIVLPEARSVDTLENKFWEVEESNFIESIYRTSPII